jgi:hypothetical protein
MPHSDDRDALIDALLADLKRKLLEQLPGDSATLDQIEEAAARIGGDLARELQRQIVARRTQAPRENQTSCPHCHQQARYRDRVARTITTRHGDVSMRRPYYWCGLCQRGFAPLDLALGLGEERETAHVRSCAARLGALLPFVEGADLLRQIAGIPLSASTLERIAVAEGTSLREAQCELAKRHQEGRLPEAKAHPRRLYVGMDGIMAPLRDGWKRDGSAGALVCRWGECKVGVLYEARAGEESDAGVERKAYVATLEDVEVFGRLVGALAHQAGHHFARELIVLGDGAAWIWRLAARYFPTAIQIVDYYHATEHLWAVGRACYGVESPKVAPWVKERQAELERDQVEQLLQAIQRIEGRSEEAEQAKQREYGYFESNRERMRYGTYRRKGYHIGSGVVEAACKQIVGARLDQAGMHWRQETAEAIVALRGALLSTKYPALPFHGAMAA